MVFKTTALNHSATPPRYAALLHYYKKIGCIGQGDLGLIIFSVQVEHLEAQPQPFIII